MKKILAAVFYNVFFVGILSGQVTQHIRGFVYDHASGQPVPYATVVLPGTDPLRGTSTDSTGHFILLGIPVGRYDLKASFTGYEPVLVKDIYLSSSRETVVEVFLKEQTALVPEVVVTPEINKSEPLNRMSVTGGRLLSVEEASRYAGGMDDPARLAASFAGVTGSIGNNGIAVRGNAPKFLLWRLEEVEIPNPNHFADVATFGGGGLTALSSQVLGNSDFFTGAFPAEYGNALSGVFDMHLRNGNNRQHEHTLQTGLTGIDIASEGPFSRKQAGSYIFNYRYSTLSLLTPLLPEDAGGTAYQDLSFKLVFPTGKTGVFSVWGTGLIDRSGAKAETEPDKWIYKQDMENQDARQFMGAAGMNHKLGLPHGAFLKTTLAATVSGLDMHTERMDEAAQPVPRNVIEHTNRNLVFASAYHRKYSARHTNKTGIRLTGLHYVMRMKNAAPPPQPPALQTVTDESGFSSLLAAYSSSTVRFSDRWQMNLGLNAQLFTLNGRCAIEPRFGLKWKFRPRHALAFAHTLHSRLEMLNYYFVQSETGERINRNLDFTRASHFVFSYDWNIGTDFHLKIEPYVQLLYRVPVIPGSATSFINLKGNEDRFITGKLENKGRGLNCGLDVTFEKYMAQGYYFMLTGSVFDSRYQTAEHVWYNTRYNRNLVFNFLSGKEWMCGKKRQNVFGANGKLSCQGGDRYSPVDEEASALQQDAVYDEQNPFSKQLSPAWLGHFTLSYKINRHRKSHEFAVKVLNVTGYREYYGHRYNFKTGRVEEEREAIVIPDISYKIEF